MILTPISDRYNLSVDSSNEPTKEDILSWIYAISLRLDGIIPLKGATNTQRIEKAIDLFIDIYPNHLKNE